MEIRLSKLARDFNVGISTLVDFLRSKGYDVDPNPNTRIQLNLYDILVKEFASDVIAKQESSKIRLVNRPLFENSITIDQKIEETDNSHDKTFIFEGIIGNICGHIEKYTGSDKRRQEKGYTVPYGVKTLRGFANIKDLAEASLKDTSYQRSHENDIGKTHVENIKEFLKHGKDVAKFLPEIVLVSRGQHTLQNISEIININNQQKLQGQILNLDYFKITVRNHSLYRIDGNHRLEAGQEMNLLVSFAIILWEESEFSQDDEAFLFHFLNGKAKQLTSEENFKGLVKSKSWSDDELRQVNPILPLIRLFNQDCLSSKLFKKEYFTNPLSQLNEILEKINLYYDLSLLNDSKFLELVKLMDELLPQFKFNYIYKEFKDLLPQFIFLTLYKNDDINEAKKHITKVDKWLSHYNYKNGSFECPINLYNISNQQLNRRIFKIFVAMPYWEEKVTPYNKMFTEILNDIEQTATSPIKLELFPIMRHKGKSERIDRRLLNQIDECDIFIADLTGCNINVIIEIAYAEGKTKPIIIIRDKADSSEIPFDIDKLQYIPYNMSTWSYSIPPIIKNNLTEVLKKDYFQIM